MSHFADGTRYGYLPEAIDGSINIGWLDASMPFTTGPVPDEFIARLIDLCQHKVVNLTRGWHYCNLCPPPSDLPVPRPVEVRTADRNFLVGHGEIRVEGANGIRYAAPDMIAHYVIVHAYQPPDEFVSAVLHNEP